MPLPTSFNPNQPIPNNPFYSPESYIIRAAYNPFIVGAGLSVDSDGVITSTGGGGGDVEIWFAKNGAAVPNSNTHYAIKNTNEYEVAALNFIETFAVGDYLELYWATDNLNIQLATPASTMGGPSVPSAIVTIVPVGA
jgi:hypothetical protein